MTLSQTKRSRKAPAIALAALAAAVPMMMGPASVAIARTPIAQSGERVTTADELPRHTYRIDTPAAELLTGGAALDTLMQKVRRDIEADLDAFEIGDATTLKSMHGTLATIALLEGHYEDAVDRYARLQELEDKPADRWITGMIGTAIARARLEGAPSDPGYGDRVRSHVRARLTEAPWELVQELVEAQKGQLEILGEGFLVGIVEAQIQPAIDASPNVSGQLVGQILEITLTVRMLLDVKEPIVDELGAFIAANRVERENIWPEREVALTGGESLAPVTIAIWDTGVDVTPFEGRLHVNEAEQVDGADDDGNGWVDDVHGIAYDLDVHRTPAILYPLDEDADRLPKMRERLKGLFDLRASIQSAEATALRADMASMTSDEVPRYFSDLMRFALYVHGTHVAGIAAEGNPFARILVARLTADHRMVPPAPTMEESERLAEMFRDVVAYFREHDVRVVNMSWVIEFGDLEQSLEQNGVGKDPGERAKIARELFAVQSAGLEAAMRSAPEILFVGGAGNSNDDVSFEQIIPPAFDLPNHIAVGAVDESGRATAFTSFGNRVDVYANGYEIESYVPGGERMKFSGTSMSSPQVTNLAAKLFAIDPSLTPERVVALILEGADRPHEDQLLAVVNPARTVAILRERAD